MANIYDKSHLVQTYNAYTGLTALPGPLK